MEERRKPSANNNEGAKNLKDESVRQDNMVVQCSAWNMSERCRIIVMEVSEAAMNSDDRAEETWMVGPTLTTTGT
jgi:hypothetical protein